MHARLLINGAFIETERSVPIVSPYDGSFVGNAFIGGAGELEAAIVSAWNGFEVWRKSTRRTRQELLRKIAAEVREDKERLSHILVNEIGKPITWARAEVARLAITFDLAADEITSFGSENLPLDFDPRGKDYKCTAERFPIGVIFGMAPYNWPYNLVAQKVAPALATGNVIVLKLSPLAPLSTTALAEIVNRCGCPPGVINTWNGPDENVAAAIQDKRVAMLSFTGSARVGWHLKSLVPDKKVLLELGGDAMAIVEPDADLEWAVKQITAGGYGYAGQVCISVQHVLAHKAIFEELRAKLIVATEDCPTGDPHDESTICGPLISEKAAISVETMIGQAVSQGASVIARGGRKMSLLNPVLLEGVTRDMSLGREEVFGPVLTLRAYGDLDQAISMVNQSQYGIQAGLFTSNPVSIEYAYREIDTGGLIVNDFPTLRFDNVPYGGVKRSGFGREGVRYSMEEMTEWKALIQRTTPPTC